MPVPTNDGIPYRRVVEAGQQGARWWGVTPALKEARLQRSVPTNRNRIPRPLWVGKQAQLCKARRQQTQGGRCGGHGLKDMTLTRGDLHGHELA
jgi:hypothetical protein